jgi:hypothetical protein
MTLRTSIACFLVISLSSGVAAADDDNPVDGVPSTSAKAGKGAGVALKRIDTNHDG